MDDLQADQLSSDHMTTLRDSTSIYAAVPFTGDGAHGQSVGM